MKGGAFLSLEEDTMAHKPFYQLTANGEVDTYTYAEWDDELGGYVHQLIEPEAYAEAKKAGKDAREVTL